MQTPELSDDARQILLRARSADGVFVLNVLEQTYAAQGMALPSELREVATAGGYPLVEMLQDGGVRLHGTPERAERALLSAARRLVGGGRPIRPGDLQQAALSTDDRLARWAGATGSDNTAERRAAGERACVIENAAYDLTAEAPFPVAGREAEVNALVVRLARRENPGAVLVGPPRSGRRSVVLRLAAALAGHDQSGLSIPPALADTQVIEVEPEMISRVRSGGARLAEIIERAPATGVVLALVGGDPHFVLTQIPRHRRALLRCIVLMTQEQWRRTKEQPDGGFAYLGLPLRLQEPSEEEAARMVAAHLPDLTAHHGRTLEAGVVETVVAWAEEHRCLLPATALEVLDESLAACPDPTVSVEHALQVIARSTRCDRAAADRWFFSCHWPRTVPEAGTRDEPRTL